MIVVGKELQNAFDEGYKQGRYDERIETEMSLPKTGKWVWKEEERDGMYFVWQECSECGRKPLLDRWNHCENMSDYCPFCGARMEGEDDENA